MADLEDLWRDVIAISIGVAIANLVKANVIGGISCSASLMKMKEAAQIQTIVLAMASRMTLFLVVYLSRSYFVLYARCELTEEAQPWLVNPSCR